jgi:uncharacterized damage-inducible protein DinB
MDAEVVALLKSLDGQREHILSCLDGLDDEQLRRPVLPSGWSALGLVRHLALDVEHYWFRSIVAGETLDFLAPGPDGAASAWVVDEGESAAEILALYRTEIAAANVVIAEVDPDAQPRQWDPAWGEWRLGDNRAILLHVIVETANHAGHLDAVRELLDGHQYLVLT